MEKLFNPYKVDVRGLSRKQAAEKRKAAKKAFILEQGCKEVCRMETNRNERAAWKVRSFMANKLRQ